MLESGEPREVHHYSLLIGYGCGAINPYLAFETLDDMLRQGLLTGMDHKTACKNYLKAAMKGVVKVISKMGISTIQSYWGAQIFEAVGLRHEFVDKYFTGTPSRVEGVGIDVIAQEVLLRHQRAFPDRQVNGHVLDAGGQYQWREDGEYHLFNPQTIHKLQNAVPHRQLQGVQGVLRRWSTSSSETGCTLRGLLEFKKAKPVPIEEVESVESIMKRFKSGAMSYGSISQEAHETLAIAMNRIGGKSNTGEGGEDPARYMPAAERRFEEQRHQASRLRAIRRHQPVPGQRQGTPDQDGPGRQARRRRPVARAEGLSVDRQGALLDAGRRADLPAAAPRHLLD